MLTDNLEKITLQMTSSLDLRQVLTTITQGLVQELDAALARIWLVGPGDLCDHCVQADHCENREQCLHLQASAGLHTTTEDDFKRVPMGMLQVGSIARKRKRFCTNDALNDKRLAQKSWLRQHALRSFAGYPLMFQEELLGVMAVFSKQDMCTEFNRLAIFANQAAIAIKNARLFAQVAEFKDRLQAENVYLQEEIKLNHNFEDIITRSEAFKRVLQQAEKVAATDATVLVLGETGTGKELVARAIHCVSPRKQRPLVKVNCAALPANLIESELFGHEKGAFTGALNRRQGRFELADGGTIFLDEIGDLPPDLQVKLLRVLQEGEFERLGGSQTLKVDVRVIAATNRNLEKSVADGSFREDLYYRLNVFPIEVPPLRERSEDIPLLVNHFVRKYGARLGKHIDTIPKQVMSGLQSYHWPGNVRELENVIERAVILASSEVLEIDEPLSKRLQTSNRDQTLSEVERNHIIATLGQTGWRIDGPRGAARRLGLHPNTLRSRMQKLEIKRPRS